MLYQRFLAHVLSLWCHYGFGCKKYGKKLRIADGDNVVQTSANCKYESCNLQDETCLKEKGKEGAGGNVVGRFPLVRALSKPPPLGLAD